MIYKLKNFFRNFFCPDYSSLRAEINQSYTDDDRVLCAKTILLLQKAIDSNNLTDYEFKVFSQWGDDGIIQHLISSVRIINKVFVEFGVQNYKESNTRFLLMNNNWSGLILDGSQEFIDFIKRQEYYWKFDLQAICEWVTKKNINQILSRTGWSDIGVLHIDIDGNDYWIWDAIDVKKFSPSIVIIEYNSVFGKERAITVPYSSDFYRTEKHYSNLYFGSSLNALISLSKSKGYAFVGCNSNGNNAYFIKKDRLGKVKEVSIDNGFVESKFRESRDSKGNLTHIRSNARLALIKGLPVMNIDKKCIEKL